MKEFINILDLCETGTKTLGPGNRYAIWVQGCPFNCKSCTTPEGIPIVQNRLIDINYIIDSIFNNKIIDGITISGGEPFLQASKLYIILKEVRKKRPDLTVIVYTGFQHKNLDWIEAQDFLTLIDLLIDGQYVEKLNNNKGLRGSTNQNFIFLTERLLMKKEYFIKKERDIEIHIEKQQKTIIGIPNHQLQFKD